ncbi:hypothetical protein [Bacillus phage vB_BtM_BMBsp2]|nr:hypothetical protein [Bacillus phage vB_BtM_BMBsp2]
MSTFLWILSGTALVGATILLWGRYEYLKQKRISAELDKERAELEQQLIEREKRKVQLEKERLQLENVQVEVKPPVVPVEQMTPNLFKSVHISPNTEEPTEIIYPMSRAQAAPTMKPTVNPRPTQTQRRTTTSVSSTPKVKSTPKVTSRSSYRRDDDDDYNNSTVLGSTWGSSDNDGRGNGDSCGRSNDSWGSDSSSNNGSWCD